MARLTLLLILSHLAAYAQLQENYLQAGQLSPITNLLFGSAYLVLLSCQATYDL